MKVCTVKDRFGATRLRKSHARFRNHSGLLHAAVRMRDVHADAMTAMNVIVTKKVTSVIVTKKDMSVNARSITIMSMHLTMSTR